MTTTVSSYRSYSRAKARLVSATEAFDAAEKKYIEDLLSDQGLEIGSVVQSADGNTVIKIAEVVISGSDGIFLVKGPVRKKDGSFSTAQNRNVFADKGSLTKYVDP